MVRNMKWIGIGALSAVLMGSVVGGCGTKDSSPDNGAATSTTSTTAVDTAASAPRTNSSGKATSDEHMPIKGTGGMGGGTGGGMAGGTGGMGGGGASGMGGSGTSHGPGNMPGGR